MEAVEVWMDWSIDATSSSGTGSCERSRVSQHTDRRTVRALGVIRRRTWVQCSAGRMPVDGSGTAGDGDFLPPGLAAGEGDFSVVGSGVLPSAIIDIGRVWRRRCVSLLTDEGTREAGFSR